jgi:hypothetical protein
MMSYQVAMSEQIVRAGFAVRTRENLCKCLLELGRNEEAQKLMVYDADKPKQLHNTP